MPAEAGESHWAQGGTLQSLNALVTVECRRHGFGGWRRPLLGPMALSAFSPTVDAGLRASLA
jgi:hypothetical protein